MPQSYNDISKITNKKLYIFHKILCFKQFLLLFRLTTTIAIISIIISDSPSKSISNVIFSLSDS